jgi:16S rRNA (adenine1518-N6/adenine1519-N6)-dimethyltransferase
MTPSARLDVASVLRRHGLRPRQSLGQNFLVDPAALQQVVEAAEVSNEDVVLEIGTGVGSLTRYLGPAARRVVGIELDPALAAISREELQGYTNVEIVEGDVLAYSSGELGLPPGYLVAANIPYYITSAILRHLLESGSRPRRIVLTVQKEVAARICAEPPRMSLLAVSVQVHGSSHIVGQLPARAFHPIPKVDSAIIRIDCYDQPRVSPAQLQGFFRTVKAGFIQPRKMLRNSMAAGMQAPAVEIESLLARAGVDARRRAETLSIDEWIRVAAAAGN